MRRSFLVVLSLLLASVTSASAQSPAERALLARWDDSVSRISSPAALDQSALPAPAATTGVLDLRVALSTLRRAALTSDRSLEELALVRLHAVATSHHSWPWPELLIARTFYGLNERYAEFRPATGAMDGESYVSAAMRHLDDALTIDPNLAAARRMAIEAIVPEGDRGLLPRERSMLRTLLRRPAPEADLLLIAGRDARTRLRHDSALAMFDRSVAAGGDRSRLDLERARTLQALGDSAGASRAYWAGVEHLTPSGREMYRHDLAWILAPDSLAAFEALSADSVEPWLRDFWLRRDAAAANTPGERLIEHLRRWNFAVAHFRVIDPDRHNQFSRVELAFDGLDPCINSDTELYDLLTREQPRHPGDPRGKEPLLDNRGLIYLHHGSPYRVVYSPGTPHEPDGFALLDLAVSDFAAAPDSGGGLPQTDPDCIPKHGIVAHTGPNESWLYWFQGSWRVLNFRASCALGTHAPSTLTSYLPVTARDAGWVARLDLTQTYAEAAQQILTYAGYSPKTCLDKVQPMIHVSRADADVATRTDSHTPFLPRPWNAVIQAFGLGSGADQTGETLISFAIPIDSLHATLRGDGTASYEVAARIVGYDLRTGRTFSVDTVREYTPPRQRTGPRGHLAGWFEFAVDPGDWQIAVRMWQPGDSIGAYNLISPVRVDGPAPLTLSDLAPGALNGTPWPAPDGAEFPLAVLGAWTPATALELYFEVRGLPQGTEYQSVITVGDLARDGKELLRITGPDRATGATTTVRKTLNLTQLIPGRYRVTVTVSHGADRATRVRDILIVKP